jgi:hypothetical protein
MATVDCRLSTIIPSVLTGSMLALGFLHGLGADHLMAIAALSLATPLGPARYARAFGLALRFAVGHAVLLALGAGLVLFFGWQIPVRFEQGGEFVGGCLLIALGVAVGWLTVSGRLYVHSHVHDGGDHAAHSHWHLHVNWWRGRPHSHRPSIHTVLPGVLGAVFAVSGLRALILSLPLWNAAGGGTHFWSLLFLVTIFSSLQVPIRCSSANPLRNEAKPPPFRGCLIPAVLLPPGTVLPSPDPFHLSY